MLNKLCSDAWSVVATSFSNTVADSESDDVADIATDVAKPGEKIGAKVSANLREPSDDTGKAAGHAAARLSVSPRLVEHASPRWTGICRAMNKRCCL